MPVELIQPFSKLAHTPQESVSQALGADTRGLKERPEVRCLIVGRGDGDMQLNLAAVKGIRLHRCCPRPLIVKLGQ